MPTGPNHATVPLQSLPTPSEPEAGAYAQFEHEIFERLDELANSHQTAIRLLKRLHERAAASERKLDAIAAAVGIQ